MNPPLLPFFPDVAPGLPVPADRVPAWAWGVALVVYVLFRAVTAYVGRSDAPPPGSWRNALGRISGATWRDAPGSLKLPLFRMPTWRANLEARIDETLRGRLGGGEG